MWKNTYKDYKPDDKWLQQKVEPGKGIIGCEMNELNGWGNTHHIPKTQKKGILRTLLNFIFKRDNSRGI